MWLGRALPHWFKRCAVEVGKERTHSLDILFLPSVAIGCADGDIDASTFAIEIAKCVPTLVERTVQDANEHLVLVVLGVTKCLERKIRCIRIEQGEEALGFCLARYRLQYVIPRIVFRMSNWLPLQLVPMFLPVKGPVDQR